MSKLGDILKELFPIRGMSQQVFGQQRTDQFVRFGAELVQNIRTTSNAAVRSALEVARDPNRRQHLANAGEGIRAIGRRVGRGIDDNFLQPVGARIEKMLGIGGQKNTHTSQFLPGSGGQQAGGQGSGLVNDEIQRKSRESTTRMTSLLSRLNRGLDGTINFFLKLAGLRYIVGNLADKFTLANRDLAKWNGSIAASFNRLDLARMRLDIQQGKATSGTAGELNRQFGELLKEFQPVREGIGNLVNIVGINLVALSRTALEGLKGLQTIFPQLKEAVKFLEDMNKNLKKGADEAPLGNQALHALAGRMGGGAGQQLPAGIAPPLPKNFFLRRHKEGRRR